MPKLDYDMIYNSFEKSGKKLLIKKSEYVDNKTKMDYICKCGTKSSITWINFKKGANCRICGGRALNKLFKKDFDLIVKDYEKSNCKLLIQEHEYINSGEKIPYICECGSKHIASYDAFMQGHRCKKCGNKKRNRVSKNKLGTEFIKSMESEGNIMLDTVYTSARVKMRYICKNNHVTSISRNNFKSGKRCRECFLLNNTGVNHFNWKTDRTRIVRTTYLSFDKKKSDILKDDPNFYDYSLNRNLYNIDHIFPRIAFIDNDLDEIYDKLIIKKICNLRENLRIITREENGQKSGKYNQEEFMTWFSEKLTCFRESLVN